MLRFKLFSFLFLCTVFTYSQNIKGIVYDNLSTVKGLTVTNTAQKVKTYSDDKGYFTISAKINDTLIFSSLFHQTKTLLVESHHFKDIIVIEVKKTINNLDEVLIKKEPEPKEFNEKEYTVTFKNQIKEDMKRRPYLYAPPPSGNIDFAAIGKLIGKLFKRKKNRKPQFTPLSYKSIDSLFNTDSFFNDKLLTEELKVPKEYKYLFFEYCDVKQINNDLLKDSNKFLLLDAFMKCSIEFLEFIKN
ncbi:hypothetical protein [Pontimicrobium sp. SW4]|uniref:Carboxypeptidase-like regulatory domain-containing protein n=1 Tax=Pontimicrobium sp. SW4 TaxID=3153519 RepID=A0AAU7BPH7_9FLAO